MLLAGCATRQYQPQAMSYYELSQVKVSNADCPNIDLILNRIEYNLQLKGLANVTPEDLNEEDRQYNSRARIIMWGLKIGCNNPGRYTK